MSLTCISGLWPIKESIRQEFRGLPEPAENKFYLFTSPESNAFEENVGKVAFTS